VKNFVLQRSSVGGDRHIQQFPTEPLVFWHGLQQQRLRPADSQLAFGCPSDKSCLADSSWFIA